MKLGLFFVLLIGPILSAYSDVPHDFFTSKKQILNYFGCARQSQSTKCNMIHRHLVRDTRNCYLDPAKISKLGELFSKKILKANSIAVSGNNLYLGFFPGKYSYILKRGEGDQIIIDTSIHFKNGDEFTDIQKQQFVDKMNNASERWKHYNPYPLNLSFKLRWEDNKKLAHIKSKLLERSTRGPYFAKWSTNWSSNTISHELGHILGLDDEYQNHPFGGSNSSCDRHSLMCSSSNGIPVEYHYYMILRRAFCGLKS